ncbi:epoxide hydrolase [Amycolatopsis sp. OK19-0408]|uniref:Epoxide hydrolase n=1 Tax=Amycolatopsis iheyensis TaxID=2945988 RepID=A0A9X2N7P7_9PSEU|nr:epoxide hydrolase family protein [Amycolatopsis iheyensis]MCR6483494.1 epoxide hydrolase [Amycolatopsis iheyensis]
METFRITISDHDLDDLRRRLDATRWPADGPGKDWERGVPVRYLRELAEHWRTQFDWRAAESELNAVPQFRTEIDDTTIHFLHAKSPEPNARPLLLTHSWPGSVVEFLDAIGPLTDPRRHGGDPADAFHVVVPSLPGHGFSGPCAQPGWGVEKVAAAWAELMSRLGYESYLTAGGDWGSLVSLELGRIDPEHVLGAHVSMVLATPSGDPQELAGLDETDLARLAAFGQFDAVGSGYMKIQSTRPDTVSFGLADSPVGQLAWVVEKFQEWNTSAKVPEDVVSRERLLANASIYWLTATGGSAAQMYYESAAHLGALFTPGVELAPVRVPVAVAAFGEDPAAPIRAFAERDYPTIVRWTEFERGGHFGAMERPADFVDDVRAFARQVAGA